MDRVIARPRYARVTEPCTFLPLHGAVDQPFRIFDPSLYPETVIDGEGKALAQKPLENAFKSAVKPEERCTKVVFKDQGLERTAWLYVPENADRVDMPLVVVLHGYGGTAPDGSFKFFELADKEGFAICWPQGAKDGTGHNCWNVGYPFQSDYKIDNTAYLRRLVKKLQKEYGASTKNVFLTGMSNGGEMCY